MILVHVAIAETSGSAGTGQDHARPGIVLHHGNVRRHEERLQGDEGHSRTHEARAQVEGRG